MALVPPRLNRSQLSAPATTLRFLEKAAASAADVVLIDLEDSIPADDKAAARDNAARALAEFDWGGKTVSVRVNAWDTPWTFRDVLALTAGGGDRLDLVMLPKVSSPADVHALDALLGQMEMEADRKRALGVELLIESAAGVAAIDAIAAASPRIEALHFGPGDYAASVGARTVAIGEQDPAYPGDLWHYPLSRTLIAARTHGLRAIDGPWARHADLEGLSAAAGRAAALGFEGKWAIHPGQIETLNAAFSPSETEVDHARRILHAMKTAAAEGRAAVTLDGRMIDVASIRQAEGLVARHTRIQAG
jgi:malyl-CoA/(S)-citramalyl-CoA lyase